MKVFLCLCCFVVVLSPPGLATPNDEIQAGQAVHEAWEIAFERADIDAVEKLWAHDGDVLIVTPLATRHIGWAEAKGALKNLFALLGPTTIEISDLFLTIDGNEASMTMTYKWSPAQDRIFPLTERYRKVNGDWKIDISDSQGETLPLRHNDEKAVAQLASQVQEALRNKDLPAIAERVADDFSYVATDGTAYLGWQPSANALSADLELIADLQLQSIALIADRACGRYVMTDASGKTLNVQLTFVGPNWKLAEINTNPQTVLLGVQPNEATVTQWARMRIRSR